MEAKPWSWRPSVKTSPMELWSLPTAAQRFFSKVGIFSDVLASKKHLFPRLQRARIEKLPLQVKETPDEDRLFFAQVAQRNQPWSDAAVTQDWRLVWLARTLPCSKVWKRCMELFWHWLPGVERLRVIQWFSIPYVHEWTLLEVGAHQAPFLLVGEYHKDGKWTAVGRPTQTLFTPVLLDLFREYSHLQWHFFVEHNFNQHRKRLSSVELDMLSPMATGDVLSRCVARQNTKNCPFPNVQLHYTDLRVELGNRMPLTDILAKLSRALMHDPENKAAIQQAKQKLENKLGQKLTRYVTSGNKLIQEIASHPELQQEWQELIDREKKTTAGQPKATKNKKNPSWAPPNSLSDFVREIAQLVLKADESPFLAWYCTYMDTHGLLRWLKVRNQPGPFVAAYGAAHTHVVRLYLEAHPELVVVRRQALTLDGNITYKALEPFLDAIDCL